jgi:hypothetical protein
VSSDTLVFYAVYRNPTDFPGKYVVRVWRQGAESPGGKPDAEPLFVGDSLEEARAALPDGVCCLDRLEGDPLHLVETWL